MAQNSYLRNISYLIILIAGLFSQSAFAAASLTFSGASREPIEITPDANTGLEKIYVLYNTTGAKASYQFSGSEAPTWSVFANLGGGFAEPLSDVTVEGNVSTLNSVQGDRGYIVADGDRQYCFWIVDYSAHQFSLGSVAASPEQPCESTVITLSGHGEPITYYTIDGRGRTLSREIEVTYRTQQWSAESKIFEQIDKTSVFESFTDRMTIIPPIYCRTNITVTGDRFLTYWGIPSEAELAGFVPNAIAVETTASDGKETRAGSESSTEDDADGENGEGEGEDEEVGSNQIPSGVDGLGGSAPAEIEFNAYVTEAVLHDEWQFASDPNFEDITHRINEREITYTFTDEGTTYVRYVGSNSDGSCEVVGETYTVAIAASELRCPNAFSPGASPGVNDEWKVSYRSLLDFECWIFDRYGQEIFHFTDPEQGWDGRRGGKLVKPGVYFYVIRATGSDGKQYKLSGDINILRFKQGDFQSAE